MSRIGVLLVDDHAIVRLGLLTLINDQPDMLVLGEAGNASDAVREVERLRPDVVLMDIRLPDESGIEATRDITSRFPGAKVVMLTSFADDNLIFRALNAGAVGYVLKQVRNEELLRAIRATAHGQAMLDPAVTARVIARVREDEHKLDEAAFRDLSDRELDVLKLVARGRTNAQVAANLNLSEKTVGHYVSTILEKLHLSNRIEMAVYAVEHHLSDLALNG